MTSLRVDTTVPLPFPALALPALESLDLAGVAAPPWDVGALTRACPALEWLSVSSDHELALDGQPRDELDRLTLTAKRLSGSLRLPARVRSLSLHLAGASAAEVGRLLAPVVSLTELSLRDTPVDDAWLAAVGSRWPTLEYLHVGDTRISEAALRAFVKRRRKVRTQPQVAKSR